MHPLRFRRPGRGEDGEEQQIVQLGHGTACGGMPRVGMLSTLVAKTGEVRFLLYGAVFLRQCRADALKCRICFLHLSAQVCDDIFEQGNLLAHRLCAHFFLMQSAVSVRYRDRYASRQGVLHARRLPFRDSRAGRQVPFPARQFFLLLRSQSSD